jgi:hypothetical protein
MSPNNSGASVLHPLPRVGELDVALDTDRRAAFFQRPPTGCRCAWRRSRSSCASTKSAHAEKWARTRPEKYMPLDRMALAMAATPLINLCGFPGPALLDSILTSVSGQNCDCPRPPHGQF